VKNSIAEQKYEVLSAGIYYIPKLYCHIENEKEASTAEALIKAFENLQGDDDKLLLIFSLVRIRVIFYGSLENKTYYILL